MSICIPTKELINKTLVLSIIMFMLNGCGPSELDLAIRASNRADSIAQSTESELAMEIEYDSLTAAQQIETVNSGLMMERISELKNSVENIEQSLKLLELNGNKKEIELQNQKLREVKGQLNELEKDLK